MSTERVSISMTVSFTPEELAFIFDLGTKAHAQSATVAAAWDAFMKTLWDDLSGQTSSPTVVAPAQAPAYPTEITTPAPERIQVAPTVTPRRAPGRPARGGNPGTNGNGHGARRQAGGGTLSTTEQMLAVLAELSSKGPVTEAELKQNCPGGVRPNHWGIAKQRLERRKQIEVRGGLVYPVASATDAQPQA